ncbi:2-polyprenyl-6-methoxyphenol hydroxylase-like FAD-dependent oxidoreductase [Bradyrhizobium sp. USDA 4524]|uniref:FAD-dependent oxidoreductase n=1 Tax=unclassified Bradyrhizobium TaxID=2631580 RepID=UPI00209FA66F|nr:MULTISPECIES: FAD-dependent oxidoreductase [unclassified Bradyrhizobium]MCP1837119.1 2-polyprenyl-6-methoxyphenol hydroxylase-like FAD-dependent oxidoreductase [Bradyrhizobium sp. USDA 4538]MCP1906138.1 2-polyprenyl-6-methoxyphenol hydroxylase-like FAD-dependent oxidoreductase [Bradyrhizobium sp. USDA 4537]MCP1988208.1 2-polyprenyl-6-methoxyphenol hydroxylase-like FAD-dependent oxidoreductase [Bradyrhizobium sp. USDA 4539]
MSKILICGGGVIGLCAATMLGRDGHPVTVLEADPAGLPTAPSAGWEAWERPGVAQFRQPHNLSSRFRLISDQELPGLTDDLLRAGCVWVDYLDSLPPSITDRTPRPGDDAIRFVTGRRPVIECAVAAMAEAAPNVTIRRGAKVRELTTGASAVSGVPHVVGVRTSSGEEIRADLVIDAMGRRSPACDWMISAGAHSPIEQAEDSNFAYFTRYFSGQRRPRRMGRALTPMGLFSILTLDGDNDTWSVTLYTSSKNKAMRALRDTTTFHRVVSACPRHAHWLDGEPITPVLLMAGVIDRYRRFVIDGQPVITGFAAVGDAWACTNPSAGRGLSVGLLHVQVLRDAVHRHIDDPGAFCREYDAETERLVGPFYRNQIAADRARIAEMNALEAGMPMPAPNPVMAKLLVASSQDADVLRGMIEIAMCLALPQEVIARPNVAAKLAELNGYPLPPDPNIIDRHRMAALLDGSS